VIVKRIQTSHNNDDVDHMSEYEQDHHYQPHGHDLDVNGFSLVVDRNDSHSPYHYNNSQQRKRPRPMLEGLEYDQQGRDEETDDDEEGGGGNQQGGEGAGEDDLILGGGSTADRTYAQKLLQYFISDDNGIPAILLRPPIDLDVNVIIDDEGHTSLHWAAAMGRLKLVQILIDLGADIYRVNYKGQTALMRSVLFTNNFDSKSFLFLIEMLKKTIFNIDKKDQTVFHHVSATASWKGKVHASRYYMECLIETLALNQSELISILNVQDVYGDTALSIAARIGNKKLVRLLMEAGASAEITNEEGMTAQDYLSEVERNNRFQPPSMQPASSDQNTPNDAADNIPPQQTATKTAQDHKSEMAARTKLRSTVEGLFKKIIVNDRSQPPVVSQIFDGFAGNYERELIQKDHLIKEKKNDLELTKKRLIGTQHTSEQIQFDPTKLELIEQESSKLTKILQKQSILLQKESIDYLISKHQQEDIPVVTAEEEKAKELAQQLKQLQESRKNNTEKLMKLRLQTPSKRHQEYKRLISMCCNVSYENVDLMLLPLLSSFDELVPPPPPPISSTQPTSNSSSASPILRYPTL
jgi:transcription factor MBP1